MPGKQRIPRFCDRQVLRPLGTSIGKNHSTSPLWYLIAGVPGIRTFVMILFSVCGAPTFSPLFSVTTKFVDELVSSTTAE